MSKRINPEQEQTIVSRYSAGESAQTIADSFALSRQTILRVLERCGMPRRSPNLFLIGKQNARKHTLDQHFFDCIDTEIKAYMLGLFCADGWVNSASGTIGLTMVDEAPVVAFKQALGSSSAIKHSRPKGLGKQDIYSFIVGATSLVESLGSLGIFPRKSLSLIFPNISKDLRPHFLRGYFDGDGCLHIDRRDNMHFSLCGSNASMGQAKQMIEEDTGVILGEYKHDKITVVRVGGNIKVAKIRDYLYRDSHISLERKRTKFFSVNPKYGNVL